MTQEQFCLAFHISKTTCQRMIRAGLIPLKKDVGIDVKKVVHALKTHPDKYGTSASFMDTFGVRGAEPSKYGEKELGQFKWQWELRLANYPGQLSMKDIAEITGYNRETIRRWVSDDRIAYVEVGKKYIISKDELRSFLRCKFFGNITRKSAVHLRLVAYSCANAYKQEKGSEN